jgi:hypothetical protein
LKGEAGKEIGWEGREYGFGGHRERECGCGYEADG